MDIRKSGKGANSFTVKGMSLTKRLPLLISILLLSLIITFSAIAYYGVKNASLAIGKERLRTLTDQMGTMFGKSTGVVSANVQAVADETIIKQFLYPGDKKASTEQVEELLKTLRKDSLVTLVELLNIEKQVVAKSGIENIQININKDSILKGVMKGEPATVGKFHKSGDSIYYAVVAGVKSGKQNIGYVVQWHLLRATQQAIEQLSQLIGTHALLYFGNSDGSLWTDMIKQVKAPPFQKRLKGEVFKYAREEGKPLLAAQSHIPGTSWIVVLEFSEELVVTAADRFLYWMLIAGLILVAVGILITTLMSRNITRPLKELTAAVSSMAPGGKYLTVESKRKDEMGRLAHAFNSMAGEINKAHGDLNVKVAELQSMTEQLRNLSAHIEKVREEERISIARDLHDELGQLLTAFKMDVIILKKRLGENASAPMLENIADMTFGVDEAIKFVRRLASDLRPQILDDLGLVAALEWFSEEFTKRYSIDVAFYPETEHFDVSPEIATGLFRMYQESLTNVARHSEATKVNVDLNMRNNILCLSVTDNGKGFDFQTHDRKKGLGLLGMKERALIIGGELEIISSAGNGTIVVIRIPMLQNKSIKSPSLTIGKSN